MSGAPVISTARLGLRPPVEADWPGYRAFLMGQRARFFGPPKQEAEARAIFDALTGHWAARGFGPFVITLDGKSLGTAGVSQPEAFPEPELVWSIWTDAAEGHGYAFEAAEAARGHYQLTHGETLVSFIDPANTRSIRLAERLGGVVDPAAQAPFPGGLTYRHPAAEADGGMEAYA